MIIGVALVVDELHKGQRLVCRYPVSIPSSVLNSHPGLLKYHEDYLSLSADNFAKLFRPKQHLHNKVFELSIDDLHYISFPCPCADELSDQRMKASSTDVITLFNVVICTVRESAIQRVLQRSLEYSNHHYHHNHTQNNRKKGSGEVHRPGFDPVAAVQGLRGNVKVSDVVLRKVVESYSRALLLQEKHNRYVSKQVAIMLRVLEASTTTTSTSTSSSSLSSSSSSSLGNSNSVGINVMVEASSSSSLMAGNQLSSQHQHQHQHLDENSSSSSSSSSTSSFSGSSSGNTNNNNNSINNSSSANASANASTTAGSDRDLMAMDTMLQQSSLANELRSIFHGLVGGHSINLAVNGMLSLSIRLCDDNDDDYDDVVGHCSVDYRNNKFNGYSNSNSSSKKDVTNIDKDKDKNDDIDGEDSSEDESDSDAELAMIEKEIKKREIKMKPYSTLLPIADSEVVLGLLFNMESCYSGTDTHNFIQSHAGNSGGGGGGGGGGGYSSVSPQLQELILAADPNKSFADLSLILEESIRELYAMAWHLRRWGMCHVINTITAGSRYRVHIDAPTDSSSKVARAFAATFSKGNSGNSATNQTTSSSSSSSSSKTSSAAAADVDNDSSILLLPLILSIFNGARTLDEAIPLFPTRLQDFAVDMLVWLLRWGMLQEVQTYITAIPANIDEDEDEDGDGDQGDDDDGDGDEDKGEGISYEEHMYKTLLRYTTIKSERKSRRKAKKIAKIHVITAPLIEIIWNENLSEEEIKAFIENQPNAKLNENENDNQNTEKEGGKKKVVVNNNDSDGNRNNIRKFKFDFVLFECCMSDSD